MLKNNNEDQTLRPGFMYSISFSSRAPKEILGESWSSHYTLMLVPREPEAVQGKPHTDPGREIVGLAPSVDQVDTYHPVFCRAVNTILHNPR